MSEAELAGRLVRLRPVLADIVGFHHLIDGDHAKTPLDAMRNRVHFTAASVKLAQEVLHIVNDILEDER